MKPKIKKRKWKIDETSRHLRMAILIFGFVMSLSGLVALPALAVTYNVPGDLTTIQACADVAQAGETCLVSAGVYPERVITKASGSENNRIVFKAQGVVTMQGFEINHAYVTVDGFDITGLVPGVSGYIQVNPANSFRQTPGGHYCEILNNTIRDEVAGGMGINFSASQTHPSADHCVVRGNTLRNLLYTFLVTRGGFHLFESNRFEQLNNRDFIFLFGHDHVFRGNVFLNGNSIEGVGNHPDWVQSFGGNGEPSYNMLFEQNWIQDLEAQLGQLNAGGGEDGLQSNIHDYIFRNNVFINVAQNMNIGVPGVRFEHNTFYRMAYTQAGVNFSGSLARGEISRVFLENNAFVSGGIIPDPNGNRGWYNFGGFMFTSEVVRYFITKEPPGNDPVTQSILKDMVANGYLKNPNGILTDKARALTDISQLIMGQSVVSYKSVVYDYFAQTIALDSSARNSFHADFNFVTGGEAEGYPFKKSFSEPHGANGGDPLFQIDFSNPEPFLGPDLKPFTIDDGLKPRSASPLCRKGEGERDIGVYSCKADEVFSDGSPPPDFPPVDPSNDNPRPNNPGNDSEEINSISIGKFVNVFNPLRQEKIAIPVTSTLPGSLLFKIMDHRGGVIKEEMYSVKTGETVHLEWNGKNKQGNIVSSGVYIVNLKSGSSEITKKVVVVK